MKKLLSLGWITSITFILGTFVLGSLLANYSFISQTISEIGEEGSSLYLQWQIFTLIIGLLLVMFSIGIISFGSQNKWSIIPGILILFAGLSEFGIALFPSPHSLHNVFGLSLIIGYFSPLIFFLLWKNKLGTSFKRYSLIAFVLILLGIFLNLSPIFAPQLYPLEYYGLVQRFLLFTFYIYLAFISFSTINSFSNIKKSTEPNKE
ncbi:MAG: DUF998 domain-containing protein [Aureibaculum sp.]|nr:DUF998 domain-containing protein [Aureibaculum sp.]